MSRKTPDRRADYPWFADITTRWMDNDVYRHVNNVVYYSFFDTVVAQHLIASGLLDIDSSPNVCLVVSTSCQYFSPIAFPDRVRAGLRVARLGTSSVTYEIGIFRNDEDLASAQGEFVHVLVERASNKPTPFPAAMRARLEALRRPEST